MSPRDLIGRDFNRGDIVAFAANEVRVGNSSYKSCGMQLGVVRGVSDNDKALVTMPPGFEGNSEESDGWIRNSKNAIVLSQFVIPEIDQFSDLYTIRKRMLGNL